jgi:hypothetical protein
MLLIIVAAAMLTAPVGLSVVGLAPLVVGALLIFYHIKTNRKIGRNDEASVRG